MSIPRMKEKPILFRLPEKQIIILDRIVQNSEGKYKSRNDLVTEIIEYFVTELRHRAETEVKTRER